MILSFLILLGSLMLNTPNGSKMEGKPFMFIHVLDLNLAFISASQLSIFCKKGKNLVP
jgi:hypothetical protein